MYVSIDIETTGLDPQACQVIEIAMVLDDRSKRVVDCPFWHQEISHEYYVGEAKALLMNKRLLERLFAKECGVRWSTAVLGLKSWMRSKCPRETLYPLGKNIGSFDWQFLKRLTGFPADEFSYRMLDIGSLYATADGMRGQSELSEQLAREYEIPGKPHEALYDARVSLALARAKWGIDV